MQLSDLIEHSTEWGGRGKSSIQGFLEDVDLSLKPLEQVTLTQGVICDVCICVNTGIIVVMVRDMLENECMESTIIVLPVLHSLGVKQRVRFGKSPCQVIAEATLADK